jgi:hypothetical protein
MTACDEHIQPTRLAGNAFKERLDRCVVRMTAGYSETAAAMKLANPLMPKRPRVTGVRMSLLISPGATYPEYNRS